MQVKLRKVALYSQRFASYTKQHLQFLASVVAHLKQRHHTFVHIAERCKKYRTCPFVSQSKRGSARCTLLLLIAIVAKEVRLLCTVALLLHTR